MAAMTDADLEQMSNDSLIFNRDAQFVYVERHFTERGDELRAAVDDQFESEFSKDLEELERIYGSESELAKNSRSLKEFYKKNFTRKGFDIICRNRDPKDLRRVRKVLKSGFVDYSDADIEYLRKFGDWDDIPLIVATLDQPKTGRRTSLLGSAGRNYLTAARVIYSLGRTRLEELLALPVLSDLLSYLIREISEKNFRELGDDSIKQLFLSKHSDVRKTAALKSVRALPKYRLAQLLDDYISGDEFRFYNVIHWLDLGVSIPGDRARSAAQKALAKE